MACHTGEWEYGSLGDIVKAIDQQRPSPQSLACDHERLPWTVSSWPLCDPVGMSDAHRSMLSSLPFRCFRSFIHTSYSQLDLSKLLLIMRVRDTPANN